MLSHLYNYVDRCAKGEQTLSLICTPVQYHSVLIRPVIYVKLHANVLPNGGHLDFLLLKWITDFIFGFLCLIKADSEIISTLEPFIILQRGYYTVELCQPSWMVKPCINLRPT